MTTIPVNPTGAGTSQFSKIRSPWIERSLWLSVMLLLCATNVMTLLDPDFRGGAYDVVARMAARPVLEPTGLARIAQMVENANPAAIERIAVAQATSRLVASSALLQQEIAGLKRQRLALAVDRKNLQNRLRDSRAAIALHKDRASELGKKVLRRAARSVTRHLAALPGHALPVLSATVAVGSVALDIQDACESVKELDALNRGIGLPLADRSGICGESVPTAEEILELARSNWRKAYERSASALNDGVPIIPWTPPAVSLESARKWLSATVAR